MAGIIYECLSQIEGHSPHDNDRCLRPLIVTEPFTCVARYNNGQLLAEVASGLFVCTIRGVFGTDPFPLVERLWSTESDLTWDGVNRISTVSQPKSILSISIEVTSSSRFAWATDLSQICIGQNQYHTKLLWTLFWYAHNGLSCIV